MALANRITYFRKKRGLSMQKLATRVGTSQQQIDRLEKGKRRLTVEWLERLSEALDCSMMDLLPESHRERDVANTTKAKVIGAIDATDGARLVEFEEKDIYTVLFGRPKNLANPRLFGLIIRGESKDFSDGTELILNEVDQNQKFADGKAVLCAARNGQYILRKTPLNSNGDEIVKAVAVKVISDI